MSATRFSTICVLLAVLSAVAEADWLRFRGPNGSGISEEAAATPDSWSPEKLKWKVALPGPGSSCPIVVGEKVFITCWSGYGEDRNDPGEQENLKRHLVCFDRNSGDKLWDKVVSPVLPEDRYGGMFAEHGYASHTPTSDGEHVFVFFGKTGVLAFDMDGEQIWQTSVGTESGARDWGSSSSLLLHKDLVIVPATAESESIVALDKKTGSQVWKAEAAGFNSTWGTPILTTVGDRTDVVIAIPGEVWGINADTGKLAWYADAVPSSSMCSSVVADNENVLYAIESGPRGGGGVALRAGGTKDVTETATVWKGSQSNRISTPIVFEGRLYSISNKTVTCMDAKTGKNLFRGRLRASSASGEASAGGDEGERGGGRRGRFGGGRGGGQDYSSPVLADGKIYYTSRNGETFVIRAGKKFEQISANRVTMDTEDFSATPAVSDGQIFIRSSKHLYCIAKD